MADAEDFSAVAQAACGRLDVFLSENMGITRSAAKKADRGGRGHPKRLARKGVRIRLGGG